MYACCTRNRLRSPPAPYYDIDGADALQKEPARLTLESVQQPQFAAKQQGSFFSANSPVKSECDAGMGVESPNFAPGQQMIATDGSAVIESRQTSLIRRQIRQLDEINGYTAEQPEIAAESGLKEQAVPATGKNGARVEILSNSLSANDNQGFPEAIDTLKREKLQIKEAAGQSANLAKEESSDNQVGVAIISCRAPQKNKSETKLREFLLQNSPVLSTQNMGPCPAPSVEAPVKIITITSPPKAVARAEIKAKQIKTPQPDEVRYQYVSEEQSVLESNHESAFEGFRGSISQITGIDDNLEEQVREIQRAIKPHIEFEDAGRARADEISPQIKHQRQTINQQISQLQKDVARARPKSPAYNQFGFPSGPTLKLADSERQKPATPTAHARKPQPVQAPALAQTQLSSSRKFLNMSNSHQSAVDAPRNADSAEFLRRLKKTTVNSRPSTPHSRPRTPKARPITEIPPARNQAVRPVSRTGGKTPVLRISLID